MHFKKERLFWKGRPSLLLYTGTYLLTLITLVCCYRLENIIYPGNYYPGFSAFFTDYLFVTSIQEWPFSNSKFLGIFTLQCLEIVVVIKSLYRLFQTIFTEYTLTNHRLIIKTFSLIGLASQEMELYRVCDVILIKPLPGLFLGLSHIEVHSNDSFTPQMTLQGLLGGKEIYKIIRAQISRHREHLNQASEMPPHHLTPLGQDVMVIA